MADEQDTKAPEPTAEDLQNFGNSPAEGTEPREKYIANFEGDEVNGRRYGIGEELAEDVDAGTIAYLVQNGRFTPKSAADSDAPALGESADNVTGTGGNAGGGSANPADPQLSDEEAAEVERLVKDNSKDELLAIADDEGVEGVTKDNNKPEIATKIVVAKRGG